MSIFWQESILTSQRKAVGTLHLFGLEHSYEMIIIIDDLCLFGTLEG